MSKLGTDFYRRTDVLAISKELLGKVIYAQKNGVLTAGMITETEAYAGIEDRASHAYGNRRTDRTEVMYRKGGVAYVYLCYGVHHLFNFVTHQENHPHAVLLRGIHPVEGIEIMEQRRSMRMKKKGFTDGPGKVTQAMGITVLDNGLDLLGERIWIEDAGIKIASGDVLMGPRVGVDYAGEDAILPYRFLLRDPERYENNKKP
ncbi:MAG: DNA-3-methyladenine glycosylase [Bacteroidetes bacterium]|nr:DNA-3-methyladenine glycosylase [Bacteroidota bacterium]